jgi:hypothetical protein
MNNTTNEAVRKLNLDTLIFADHGDPNFPSVNKRLAWRFDGEIKWSHLYNPTTDAKAWDNAPSNAHAIGSRYGCFGYVVIRETGRKTVFVPRTQKAALGVKAKVTFDSGTEDERTLDAWIVE